MATKLTTIQQKAYDAILDAGVDEAVVHFAMKTTSIQDDPLALLTFLSKVYKVDVPPSRLGIEPPRRPEFNLNDSETLPFKFKGLSFS